MSLQASPSLGTTLTSSLPSARVLVIDAQAESRQAITASLSARGAHALAFAQGLPALDALVEGIDALILDAAVQDLDGRALFEAIASLAPGLPALVLEGLPGRWAERDQPRTMRRPLSASAVIDGVLNQPAVRATLPLAPPAVTTPAFAGLRFADREAGAVLLSELAGAPGVVRVEAVRGRADALVVLEDELALTALKANLAQRPQVAASLLAASVPPPVRPAVAALVHQVRAMATPKADASKELGTQGYVLVEHEPEAQELIYASLGLLPEVRALYCLKGGEQLLLKVQSHDALGRPSRLAERAGRLSGVLRVREAQVVRTVFGRAAD